MSRTPRPRLRPWSGRRRRRREAAVLTRDLPAAVDLLAACLASGASAAAALEAVAAVTAPPLRARLASAAGALVLGAAPVEAWGSTPTGDPLAPLARAFSRSASTGAPLAVTIGLLADEQRREKRGRAEAAARRAGVLAVGPLVVCFLPAFLLVGIVPVVVGVASAVLDGIR